MYGLLTAGQADPEVIARVLAEAFGVPLASVDVSPASEMENRNWDATVTCEYEVFSGDLACQLSVYGAEEVAPQPSEDDLAAVLARELATPVLISWGTLPWIRKVVTPQGEVTFARVEDPEDEGAGCRVYATEAPVVEFAGARVEGFPEVVRDLPAATPLADGLFPDVDPHSAAGKIRTLVWGWEALISRMVAGWPPSRWYGAEMYREDLENRDRLGAVLTELTADELAFVVIALLELDARFRDFTVDDDGEGLAEVLRLDAQNFSSSPWYWRRRPATPPWVHGAQ
ncbi:hypothetical protein ACH4U5_30460 [Streptomyces sp. NPDC020858]|uniref:hypothetical protein n=1 Tax=Streptomyces sp. NPDC020858 TaxID=3365097 RepID=UPI003798FF13